MKKLFSFVFYLTYVASINLLFLFLLIGPAYLSIFGWLARTFGIIVAIISWLVLYKKINFFKTTNQNAISFIKNKKYEDFWEENHISAYLTLSPLFLFLIYLFWSILNFEGSDCETITYQDFDSQYNVVERRGQLCGYDLMKYKQRNP